MKKLSVLLMILLFAAGAFAQDAKGPEFKYNVWATAFAKTEATGAKDEVWDYSQIRVRPMFTAGNDNVKVVTFLEIDQFYGEGGTTTVGGNGSGSNSGYADPDADQIAVEVKNIYIDVKDAIMPGLSLRAGIAPFVYSVGYNNDMPQFNVLYDAGMVKFDLAYVKVYEGLYNDNTDTTKNDGQMYSFKAAINAGDITITPSLLYAVSEKDRALAADSPGLTFADNEADIKRYGTTGEFTKIMPALGIAMKSGPLSVNADFQYIMGENKTADVDIKAYAGYVNVGYKVSDALSVNLFGLYATGQDDSDDLTSFNAASGDEIEVGPLFIVNSAGWTNAVDVSYEYDVNTQGLIVFGLSASMKMDKLTVFGQVAYAMTQTDDVYDESAIGTELNLRLAYEIAPATSLWVEGAYLMSGKFVEVVKGAKNDDPMYYAAGISTRI